MSSHTEKSVGEGAVSVAAGAGSCKLRGKFQRRSRAASRLTLAVALGAVVGQLSPLGPSSAKADHIWSGAADTDWNNPANWTSAEAPGTLPAGHNLTVNSSTGNIATITADTAFMPVDIFVGDGAGDTGQVNHVAGVNRTGNSNWMFVGQDGGTGTYNLTGTGVGAGATGFDQGSGSLHVGNNVAGGGRLTVGDNGTSVGTFNMNTSGTLTANQGRSMNIGTGAGTSGTFNLDNGTVAAGGTVSIGVAGGSTGTFNMNNGTVGIGGEIFVAESGTAVFNQTGGTVSSGAWFVVGRNVGSIGTYNLSGGTVNAGTVNFGVIGAQGGTGIVNVSGGTFNSPNRLLVGETNVAQGTLNVTGGLVDVGHATLGLRLANAGSATGVVNLDGGTIQTTVVTQGTGTGGGTFNFNGGTLKAAINTANFMGGLTRANVRNGGALIDSNGFNITVAQPLLHSDIAGDNAIDGGLAKSGAGALTLSGVSSYTGNTTVSGGSLIVGGAGDINTTGGITVNGSGARFVNTSSVAVTPVVTVTSGGVDGTGTIDTVNVANNAANTVANGNGGTGTLTIGALTFDGAATFNLNVAGTTPVVATTTLSTNAAGNIVVNATNNFWNPGQYDLISYGTLSGAGFAPFQQGTISGLSPRQSATLTNPAGFISLEISGENPKWTGALNSNWTTATQSSPKNWQLTPSGTSTDFITGDLALFDDSASNFTVNVSDANVTPGSTTFDNSTSNYVLNGAFGVAGSGPLIKSGTGALTINNANTYSGGTTLNAGTLNINNASALGTGALTVAGGAIDNTSGSAVTLANNAQNWNADFTFVGSNALNTGTGAVTLSGDRAVTVNGAPLTVGGPISGPARDLIKNGPGTLVLSGNNTYGDDTIVNAGTLSVTGGSTGTQVEGAHIVMAPTSADVAHMTVSGGTVNADRYIVGGNVADNDGGTATLTQTGGTINTRRWFAVGSFGNGTFDFSGGIVNTNTANAGTQMEVGALGAGHSTMNLSGTAEIRLWHNSNLAVGGWNNSGSGTVNQTGGSVTSYSNAGTTVGGGGNVFLGGGNTTGDYTYNLSGGTVNTGSFTRTSTQGATGTLNLNGGTLRSTRNNADLINNLTAANVQAGGAIIDTNGNNVTISQPLLHDASGPAIDGGLTKNGAGTLRLAGAATYTGGTVINGGTLQLPAFVPASAVVGGYSFEDAAPGTSLAGGTTIANSGSGGAAMNGTVNHADNPFYQDGLSTGATIVEGRFGNALSLDGAGSSVDVASQIVNQAGDGSWTLSGWVKTAFNGSSILSKNNADPAWQGGESVFYLGSNPIATGGGSLPTAVRNGGGFMQGDASVTDDQWHMVTFVSSGGAKSIYVDGALVPMTMSAFNNADPSTLVRLGFTINTVGGDGTAHFAGAMDEIKFFDGVLTASQIQALFADNTFTASTSGGGAQYLPLATTVSIPVSGAALDLNGNNQTIGSLAGVAGSSVLLGAGTLTTGGDNASTSFAGDISGAGGLTKAGTGTMALSGNNTYTGATDVNGGMLKLESKLTTTSTVNVGSGAVLEVASGGGSNRVVKAPSVTIAATGRIDLRDNKLITEVAPGTADATGTYTGLQREVQRAYNFTNWDQPGLMTSMPDAKKGLTTIGIATGKQIRGLGETETALWGGETITAASTLAMYTYAGDANLDGQIDAGDYGIIDNFVQIDGASGYGNGDFNYDGFIDAGDYGIIDNNIQAQTTPFPTSGSATALASSEGLSGVTAVPEPASAFGVALLAAGVLGRRRRRD